MESGYLKNQEEVNHIEPLVTFGNIKGDYFLQLLFNNLERKRLLEILKYNKNIKKRINININDYKEYSEKYSSIEIEIKPVDYNYGKFISYKKEDEKYYHIYFNKNKKEVKRIYIKHGEKIKKIKIIIDYQIDSFKYLFYYCECIESIYFNKF